MRSERTLPSTMLAVNPFWILIEQEMIKVEMAAAIPHAHLRVKMIHYGSSDTTCTLKS